VNRTRFFESLLRRLFLSYQDVDWERTTAFAMGGFGQIYIRQGKGGGNARPPEEGYEASRDRVISTLANLRIPGTQKNYLQKIYTREQLYRGPCTSDLPDLIVMPEEGYLDPGDFEWFSNAVFEPRTPVTGTHRSSGIFLLRGPGIRPGVRLKGIRIYDIAPSILHLMGQPVPEGLDGKVLADAFQNAGDYSSLE
jgi:predicted AlkP superfamily phosphohydrolase/phosphomutase